MDLLNMLEAGFLGLIEGLTEFIPVSSTGHLILAGNLVGFRGPAGAVFEIVIQLGAILAILVLYARTLSDALIRAPNDPRARRFILSVLLAFLPAALVGAVAHHFIKTVLMSPWVVSVALIAGGIAILLIERLRPDAAYDEATKLPLRLALAIGACQVLAMIPGVSRSGATIMGALVLGVTRKAAAEFSFFLAIPTMFGATAYDLYVNRHALDLGGAALIAIGFVVAFLSALLVIRWMVEFISRHGFGAFAWYRIVAGVAILGVLLRG